MLRVAFFIVLAILGFAPAASGQDIPPLHVALVSKVPVPVYVLHGGLPFGSEARFAAVVGDRRGGVLLLDSSGGSVTAAIAIGRLVRLRGIATVVPPHVRCLSGCAIIWAGGVERSVGDRASLGFHRPYSIEEGRIVYGPTGDVVAYFRDMGFPDAAIERFLWPSEGLWWMTRRQAESLGVEADFQY